MTPDSNTSPDPLMPNDPQPPMPAPSPETSTPIPTEPAASLAAPASETPNPTPPTPPAQPFTPQVFTPAGYPPQGQFPPTMPSATPVVSEPQSTPSTDGPKPIVVTGKQGGKKKLLAGLVLLAGVVALGGGYVFGIYLPNTPSAVYASSLHNTSQAVDRLITYSKQQQQVGYTSTSIDGTMNVKSPSGSYDLTLNGSGDKNNNASVTFNADVMGEKVTGNFLSVHVAGSTTPDIYVQVKGVKHYLDSMGMNTLDYLDGQWIAIDHTLIDTYESALMNSMQGMSSMTNPTAAETGPTAAQLEDAATKVQTVNKQYLFTEDTSKAVLVNEKFIGKEKSGGRTLDHYVVGYNKANLETYVSALGTALDGSSLNTWAKQASGNPLSQMIDLSSLKDQIKTAKSDYTFDLWADTQTKLISKLGLTDPSTKQTLTLSQDYTGGNQFPFSLSMSGKNTDGNNEDTRMSLLLDSKTNKVTLGLADTTQASDGTTTMSGNFTATPGKSAVKVSAPTGAKPVVDILNSLGLGSMAGGGTGASMNQSTSPMIFQQ